GSLAPRPAGAELWAVSLALWRAKSRFARQGPCHESSAVPVRAIGRKCLETRSVYRAATGAVRPFVKHRTNPAQACLIFSQRCPERPNAHALGIAAGRDRAPPRNVPERPPPAGSGGRRAPALIAALRRAGSDRDLRSRVARSPAAGGGS